MNLICVASISSNGFPGNRTVGYQISPPRFHEKFLSGIAKIAKVKVKIRNSAVFFGGNSTLRIWSDKDKGFKTLVVRCNLAPIVT